MSIRSNTEFENMRTIGGIVARALRRMAERVLPGITTGELNAIGSRVLAENGARSAPPLVYGYPADVCISVNDEAMHGIPGARVIQPGDLVKLDLVAEKDGFFRGCRNLGQCSARERVWPRSIPLRRARILARAGLSPSGKTGVRDWTCGGARGAAVRLQRDSPTVRAWRWP